MNRRDVLIVLALPNAASTIGVHAETPSVSKRVGMFSLGKADDKEELDFERSFREHLGNKGWSVGKNLAVVRVYAEDRPERLAGLVRELIGGGVDVIVTSGQLTTVAAARATRSIPIVFAASLPFAIEQGLIDSFARPGRNVTGAVPADTEIIAKRLDYLKQIVPSAKRLAWVLPDLRGSVERLAGGFVDVPGLLSRMARAAGFETRFFVTRARTDMAAVFAEIDRWGAQALTASPLDDADARQLAEMAFKRKLPNAFGGRDAIEAGALLSYSPKGDPTRVIAELASSYVDRVLRGADPATLPIEFASRYELILNARTAAAFGLPIPLSLLVSAELVR